MYEDFKNSFISNMLTNSINLNQEQVEYLLQVMDRTAKNYDFYEKQKVSNFIKRNGVPCAVYEYIHIKESEGLSPQTIYGYKTILELFFKYMDKDIEFIEPEDVRLFLFRYQSETGISNRTLDKYREYIVRFFTWLYDSNSINYNLKTHIKPIKYEVKPREALSQYELEILRMNCITAREKAILEFFYSTGCRVSELINIKFSDIDFTNDSVHIIGKGRKHRVSFLTARCKLYLEEYLKCRPGSSEYIFVKERSPYDQLSKEGVERIIRKIRERAEINKSISPHVIRHTTATHALHNGMSIDEISMLLGHDNIETTMIYAKTSYDSVKYSHNKCLI